MTAQIDDVFRYKGADFSVAGIVESSDRSDAHRLPTEEEIRDFVMQSFDRTYKM